MITLAYYCEWGYQSALAGCDRPRDRLRWPEANDARFFGWLVGKGNPPAQAADAIERRRALREAEQESRLARGKQAAKRRKAKRKSQERAATDGQLLTADEPEAAAEPEPPAVAEPASEPEPEHGGRTRTGGRTRPASPAVSEPEWDLSEWNPAPRLRGWPTTNSRRPPNPNSATNPNPPRRALIQALVARTFTRTAGRRGRRRAAVQQCSPGPAAPRHRRPPAPEPAVVEAQAVAVAEAGWHPLPGISHGAKALPAKGLTGRHRRVITANEVADWNWDGNLAVRIPEGVIGVDIDVRPPEGDRPAKRGLEHFRRLVGTESAREGLALAWVSSRRHLPSGIYFYRLPEHLRGDDGEWPAFSDLCTDVEALRFGWRYALIFPAVVDGLAYKWHPPVANPGATGPPKVADLAFLPAEWEGPFLTGQPAEPEPSGGWSPTGGHGSRRGQGATGGRHGQLRQWVGHLIHLQHLTDRNEIHRLLEATPNGNPRPPKRGASRPPGTIKVD